MSFLSKDKVLVGKGPYIEIAGALLHQTTTERRLIFSNGGSIHGARPDERRFYTSLWGSSKVARILDGIFARYLKYTVTCWREIRRTYVQTCTVMHMHMHMHRDSSSRLMIAEARIRNKWYARNLMKQKQPFCYVQ